jgi:hypothetical protein
MPVKRFLFLLLFLGLIPFSCGTKDPYYELSNLSLEAYRDNDLSSKIYPTDTVDQQEVFFKASMNLDYVSTLKIALSSQLLAFKKAQNGYKGLKTHLSHLNFFSDKLFNGRMPGSPLGDLLICREYLADLDLSKTVEGLNERGPCCKEENYEMKFYLKQRPNDSLSHHFTLEFNFSDGTKMSSQARVNWK